MLGSSSVSNLREKKSYSVADLEKRKSADLLEQRSVTRNSLSSSTPDINFSPPYVRRNLSIHEKLTYEHDLLLHPDLYSDFYYPGCLVRISQEVEENTDQVRELILKLPPPLDSKNLPQGSALNFQISISKQAASVCDFVPRREVTLERVSDEKSLEVELALITFKDHYLGRADMYHIKRSLQNEFLYCPMKLSYGAGIRLTVQELSSGANSMTSGLITKNTKIAFRSRSARMFILLQMSREMWEFAEDSDLYFERCVNRFIRKLFERWHTVQATHSVTIIFFSRVYYTKEEVKQMKRGTEYRNANLPLGTCADGYFRDFYKVVIDSETRSDWTSAIQELKREFMRYPSEIEWQPSLVQGSSLQPSLSIGTNSNAHQGNFLEAVNLTLGEFSRHHIDRDLRHTGQNMIVLSAGCGFFEVDRVLADLTKQKIIDTGVGCDLVCVARPPFHAVPLFLYRDDEADSTNASPEEGELMEEEAPVIQKKPVYKFPFWIYISFFSPGERTTDTLVCSLMQSLSQDRKDTGETSFPMPLIQCKGSYSQWITSESLLEHPHDYASDEEIHPSRSNESLAIEAGSRRHHSRAGSTVSFNALATTPAISIASSASTLAPHGVITPFMTPTLAVRSAGGAFDVRDGVSKFSFESGGGSFGTAHGMMESVGSFTTVDFSQFGSPRLALNKAPSQHYGANPFDLSVVVLESSSSRRWSHMFPRVSDRTHTERNISAPNLYTDEANWRSFTEPACLPLGTDYIPTQAELNKHYLQGSYTLSLLPGEDVYHNRMDDLLQELISQRLAQNYQLVEIAGTRGENTTVMALGHIFHVLTYDEAAQNITVKRFYLKHKLDESTKPFRYHYALWPVNHGAFLPTQTDILRTKELLVNWNAVDQLISGESSHLNGNMRLWRIQLVVLTNDTMVGNTPPPEDLFRKEDRVVDAEELRRVEEQRVQAFMKFIRTLFRHRIFKKEITLDVQPVTDYSVAAHGSLDNFNMDGSDPSSIPVQSEDQHLAMIVEQMRQPKTGIQIKDKKRTLTRRTIRRCFEGRDLISWILRNGLSSHSREAATELAEMLMARGFVLGVSSSQKHFEDSSALYRFAEDQNVVDIRNASIRQKKFMPITPTKRVNQNPKASSRPESTLSPPVRRNSLSTEEPKHQSMQYPAKNKLSHSVGKPLSRERSEPATLVNERLSQHFTESNVKKSVKVEIEDRGEKTDRYQWILLEYDSLFLPSWCYHIGIQWMICTGSAIQEVIAQMDRQAKQCSLKVVQVPVEESNHAYRAPMAISVPSEVDKHSLLSRFGFVPYRKVDNNMEYLHKSGLAIIQCREEELIWTYNHTPTLQQQMSKAATLLDELIEVCRDLMSNSDSETDDGGLFNLFTPENSYEQPGGDWFA